MIQHIVLFRVKDGTPRELQQKACDRLEGLAGKIPGVRSLKAGLDIGVSGNFDFGLVAELDDQAALDRFSTDAGHLDVAYWILEFREEIAILDIAR
ncbi:stress protein [Sphingobium lactosutens]|uniref:Dabb family protein n=1 Tax=Sphingobium lactosutens TaxID=522773 RepID=UPI0015BE301F|nr:Dabb family protein [Sphingobium lactosutens]NWK94311.1 stress protein [Sphingobium lactosutens]